MSFTERHIDKIKIVFTWQVINQMIWYSQIIVIMKLNEKISFRTQDAKKITIVEHGLDTS